MPCRYRNEQPIQVLRSTFYVIRKGMWLFPSASCLLPAAYLDAEGHGGTEYHRETANTALAVDDSRFTKDLAVYFLLHTSHFALVLNSPIDSFTHSPIDASHFPINQ
jgi:hypothetical protein